MHNLNIYPLRYVFCLYNTCRYTFMVCKGCTCIKKIA